VAAAHVAAPGRGNDRAPTVYARAARREDGGAWLQYWMFYPAQDQDRGLLRTGRHEGDWELVQFRLDRRGRPREAVYAQHSGAERCAWSVVERKAGRPVVYAARGSHASYLRAGVRDRMWPDPNDEADGRGAVFRPRIVRVSADAPAWMRWPGRWGGARAGWWVPGEQSSPRGPAFQPDGRWSDPEAWADRARACQAHCDQVDECDGGETALGAVGVAALVGAGGFGWHRRRRRRARLAGA
jgi:hypothetical protein